jgi:hypothetical protein
MLSARLLLPAVVLPLSALAFAQAPTGATPERVAAIADCKGRWFEAAAVVDPATKRGTRIRLCSKPGATDAEWIKILRDAADQLNKRVMPAEPKARLLAQIDAAIAKVSAPVPAPVAAAPAPAPPIMVANSAPPAGVVPSSPAAPPPARPTTVVPAPAIALTCAERGQPGEGPCGLLGRDTILVVRAVSGLDQGARLRLLRRGEDRGEIKLAALPQGQAVRAALPEKLCAGINSSKVEFQLLGPTGVAGQRFGPYSLRC